MLLLIVLALNLNEYGPMVLLEIKVVICWAKLLSSTSVSVLKNTTNLSNLLLFANNAA